MEYSVEISDFSGPLDLLLHLIEKSKVDIKNIFVSEITEQYLEYVSSMKQQDMELSSEFLTLAATLLLIKSRSLLPKHEDDEELFDEEYEKQLIIDRLEEYKLIKSTTDDLRSYEKEASKYFTKLPEEISTTQSINLDNVDKDTLYRAFIDVMNKKKIKSPEFYYSYVSQDRFNIKERIEHILDRLSHKNKIAFDELFDDVTTKTEVVVTFCAILELLNMQVLRITQKNPFGNIYCFKR